MARVISIAAVIIAGAHIVSGATAANVCQVTAHSPEFDGKPVVIEAIVRAGTHYEMFLASADCDRLLTLAIPNRLSTSAEVEKLWHLVFAGFPKTLPKPQARATFVGTLHVGKTVPHFITFTVSKVSAVTGLPSN
jgi:hypothetical protein